MRNGNSFLRGGIIVLMTSMLAACADNYKVNQPALDTFALQELQTREFEAPFKMTYAAVLTVLQDVGYIVESADGEAGLITAKSPTQSKTTYNLFWGFGKGRSSTRVTAFVEPLGPQISKLRINFVSIKQNSNIYGMNSQEDTPIEDDQVYNTLFERVAEAIFIRQAM